MAIVETYSYLWDGSDPGWVVREHIEDREELFLVFGETGPTTTEIRALRQAIPSYSQRPASDLLRELKGVRRLVLGDFEAREARKVRVRCGEAGLQVQEKAYQRRGRLLFNEVTRRALLIEDDAVAAEVAAFALKQGLPKRESTG